MFVIFIIWIIINSSNSSLLSNLPNQSLVVEIPDSYISIGAAGKADFGVRADGKGITCRC